MKILKCLIIILVVVCLISGCGVLRSLTTKSAEFNYRIPSPPVIQSPIGTQGQPLVKSSSVTITGDLVNKYDKHHGGIYWAALEYNASFEQGEDISVRFLASLTPPNESNPIQIPDEAIEIETIELSSTEPVKNQIASSDEPNKKLKEFISDALKANSGDFTVYLFFEVESSSGGRLELSDMWLRGRAYGSLF